MHKHVISVGFEIPGDAAECVDFSSDSSLLDADIVVFSPNIENYEAYESYQGKSLLTEHDSGRIEADSSHWNRELHIALEEGKTVFVVMLGVETLYIDTGEKSYSGTGRNARATRVVSAFDPYSAVPIPGLGAATRRRAGERIKTTRDIGALSAYWREFGPVSYYQAYLDENIGVPALVTQTGDKMVGGIVRQKDLKGTLVLLPSPNLSYMAKQRDEKRGAMEPSTKAPASDEEEPASEAQRSVSIQFISALVEIDKVLRIKSEKTPPPTWATAETYAMGEEARFRAEVSKIEAAIEELEARKLQAGNDLENAGNLRGLLFEKGKSLESAVLEALQTIGFHAERFADQDSEFDAVFTDSSGTRLLGEAEGKDDKAINIDKLDQLDRNIQEDYAKRPDSAEYAKGVLFGNAFRFLPPAERGDFFTQKCLAGARRLGVALVKTPDLFVVAKFVRECANAEFAVSCREAILNTTGQVVVFPHTPTTSTKTNSKF